MRNLFALSALAIFAFITPALAAGKPVVKIGISAPLTGDSAHLGESMKNAMQMAIKNIPATTKFDYQLVVEDDGLQAKKTAAATNKLISVDHVDALATISSGTGGVASPIAEQNKIIHFGIASAHTVSDGQYNFIHWTRPAEEARVMAEELKKRGIKKVALLEMNHPAFVEMKDDLKKAIAGSDTQIVTDEVANAGEKDFKSMIAKAKESNPDIYMLNFFSPELEIAAKQLREAGVTAPMTSIEGFSLSSQPQLYEGQWFVDAGDAKKQFYDKYQAAFKKAPQLGAPNAYDIVNLIVYGFENAPAPAGVKPTEASVAKTLQTVKNLDGMMGKISIDKDGVVSSPASVKIIKDGKPTAADTADAGSAPNVEPAAQ